MHHFERILLDNIDIWSSVDLKGLSRRGRTAIQSTGLYGIKKFREVILGLASSGRLLKKQEYCGNGQDLLLEILEKKNSLLLGASKKRVKPLKQMLNSDTPFALPSHWVWVRLGDITNFGSTEKQNFIKDDTWVLDLEDIEKDTSRLLQKCRYFERRSLSDKNSFKSGDVLYGKLRPYLNKVIVADEDGICTTEIVPIRCYGPFVADYFKYILMSPYFLRYATSISYGMKMPRLGTEGGRNAPFPLPPLAEQAKISAKVDQLMVICDLLERDSVGMNDLHEKLLSTSLDNLIYSSFVRAAA